MFDQVLGELHKGTNSTTDFSLVVIRTESPGLYIVSRIVEKFDGGFVTERFTTTVTFEGKPLKVLIGKRGKLSFQKYSSIQVTVWKYNMPVNGILYFKKSGKFVKYTAIDLLTGCSYTIPRIQLTNETIEFFESCIAASFNYIQVKEATL